MKKNARRIILLSMLLILILGLIIYIILQFTKSVDKGPEENRTLKEIVGYGYILEEGKTPLFNNIFEELVNVLTKEDVNKEQYAILISKLFIVDFYDLNSKRSKNDIGGIQFIYDDIRDNFVLKARDTLYKYVEDNIYGDRKQLLPSIVEVNLSSIEQVSYTYNDKVTDEAFQLELTWEYEKDLGYQDTAIIFLVNEQSKLSIVELKEVGN